MGNPAHSLPDQATVRRALERAEFVLLQETFAHTATARYADLLLALCSTGVRLDGVNTLTRPSCPGRCWR